MPLWRLWQDCSESQRLKPFSSGSRAGIAKAKPRYKSPLKTSDTAGRFLFRRRSSFVGIGFLAFAAEVVVHCRSDDQR